MGALQRQCSGSEVGKHYSKKTRGKGFAVAGKGIAKEILGVNESYIELHKQICLWNSI